MVDGVKFRENNAGGDDTGLFCDISRRFKQQGQPVYSTADGRGQVTSGNLSMA